MLNTELEADNKKHAYMILKYSCFCCFFFIDNFRVVRRLRMLNIIDLFCILIFTYYIN